MKSLVFLAVFAAVMVTINAQYYSSSNNLGFGGGFNQGPRQGERPYYYLGQKLSRPTPYPRRDAVSIESSVTENERICLDLQRKGFRIACGTDQLSSRPVPNSANLEVGTNYDAEKMRECLELQRRGFRMACN